MLKDICILKVIVELFTIGKALIVHKLMQQIKNKTHTYTMKFYLTWKQNEILSLTILYMKLQTISFSERGQAQ